MPIPEGKNYRRMLAPRTGFRVDVHETLYREKLKAGWVDDPFPDDRDSLRESLRGKHAGRGAIVFGSGPSCGLADRARVLAFVKANNLVAFGVNDAWRCFDGKPVPALDYHVIIDSGVWDDQRGRIRELHAAFPGALPLLHFDVPDEDLRYARTSVDISRDVMDRDGLAIPYVEGSFFHGWSVGVLAIQIALQMGCGPIYLLGHDLCTAPGRTHGFGVRCPGERSRDYPQKAEMFRGYEVVARHARELGVRVVNLSPISVLECFERGAVP